MHKENRPTIAGRLCLFALFQQLPEVFYKLFVAFLAPGTVSPLRFAPSGADSLALFGRVCVNAPVSHQKFSTAALVSSSQCGTSAGFFTALP